MKDPNHDTRTQTPSKAPKTATTHTRVAAEEPLAEAIQRATLNPRALTPGEVMQLQRTVGNRAVTRLLSPTPSSVQRTPTLIQRTFDEGTITEVINSNAQRIDFLGGTEGAYEISTDSPEHSSLVLKLTDNPMPVFAAALAQAVEVNTPEIIALPAAGIAKKIAALNPALGKKLASKESVTVQKFINGRTLVGRQALGSEALHDMGRIATFDMMIGKTDLFNNYDSSLPEDYNEQNFKNIIFKDGRAFDIDLANGVDGSLLKNRIGALGTQQKIIEDILADPTVISPFVRQKIGGMLEEGPRVSVEGSRGLLIQRGMVATVLMTAAKAEDIDAILRRMPKTDKFAAIVEMVTYYQTLGKRAASAIKEIDAAYERVREQEDARDRERELARERERQARELEQQKRDQKEQSKCGCFLTTACVEYKGLPDDCEELTTLRHFRDSYMRVLPEGSALIREYYALAPALVRRIWEEEDYGPIWEGMYEVVTRCVRLIQAGNQAAAMEEYIQTVLDLKEKYLDAPVLAT